MRHATILRLVLTLILTAALAAGCAKKPTPAEEEDAVTREEAPTTTEMSEEEVSGIDERDVSESEVADEAAARDEAAMDGLERIYFGFDQYTLSEEARETLKENAEYLEANPDVEVRIEGHTDQIGSDEYNLALGERRAGAAEEYLTSLGIDEDRLSTISYGEEKPLDPAQTEEARAQNRRVEFKVVR